MFFCYINKWYNLSMKSTDYTISFCINLIIFVLTAIFSFQYFWEDGKWSPSRARKAFRYFTNQSNVLCAISAILMCFFPYEAWAYYLKVIGTAAVTVTMLTVLFFLGPTYGYKYLYKGADLFLHLITPIMALVSLCLFERRGISLTASFLGIIPVALYAPLYLYKIVYAPEEKGWEDFYGFNKGGKWQISYVLMLAGTALICVALYLLLNV